MNEKTKKALMSLGIRFLLAAGIFAIIFIADKIFPSAVERISGIWTKNINLKRAGELVKLLLREIVPF